MAALNLGAGPTRRGQSYPPQMVGAQIYDYDYPYEFFIGSLASDFSIEVLTELVSLFSEADRRPAPADRDETVGATHENLSTLESVYEVPASLMRERLEIMGFNATQWQEELRTFAESAIEAKDR